MRIRILYLWAGGDYGFIVTRHPAGRWAGEDIREDIFDLREPSGQA
jgi:hypothetical protein